MKYFKSACFIFCLSLLANAIFCQELKVVYLLGDVKVYKKGESHAKAKKLVFGPLAWEHIVILGNNSALKILRQNGEICELDKKGSYELSKQTFLPKPESSLFQKFNSYLQSFFGIQHAAEDLSAHHYNILAGTRGDGDSPIALSPLAGRISLDYGELEFRWLGICDTCNCQLKIFDASTKSIVFQTSVKAENFILNRANKYLKPNIKYYWTIAPKNCGSESNAIYFSVAPMGEFNYSISNFEKELCGSEIMPKTTTGQLLTLAHFIESNQINYALLWARKLKKENPKNTFLINNIEEACWKETKKLVMENQ